MSAMTVTTCTQRELYYVEGENKFWRVNQNGKKTELFQMGHGLWSFGCSHCQGKFHSWQEAQRHLSQREG